MHEWRVGQLYRGSGPGTWRVVWIGGCKASLYGDNYEGPHSASGVVVLHNDAMDHLVVAPPDDLRLRHLQRVDDTPAWKD